MAILRLATTWSAGQRQTFFGALDLFAVPFVVCPLVGRSLGQTQTSPKCTICAISAICTICFMWARDPGS